MRNDDGQHMPDGAITLQRLSRSFETIDETRSNRTDSNDFTRYYRRSTDSWDSETRMTTHEPREETTQERSAMESQQQQQQQQQQQPSLPTKPAMVWDAKDYSDLEVVVDGTQTWDSNDKMPVLIDYSEEKIATPATPHHAPHNALLSPSVADPVPAYPASLHSRNSTYPSSPLPKGADYSEFGVQPDGESTRGNERRIWGMNNKQLSLVTAGLVGFILVLLATVLAITLSMNRGKSTGQPVSLGVGDNASLLNSSRLAALNWTDTTGLDRSLVFYQDTTDSIMVSIKDSASNEWAITNVTQAVMNSTGAKRLDVLTGTPLAAVTNLWQVSLYYLTTSNYIGEIWCSDVVSGNWFAGSLASDLNPSAMNGSRLSAYWQMCTNCSNSLVVLHQQTDGNLMLANFTNNAWELSGPITDSVSNAVNQTGLAIRPVSEGSSNNTFGTDLTGWRVYEFDSTGIVELQNGRATNFTWDTDFATNTQSTTVTSDPSPEIAAITYGDHGWTSSLVTYLTSDGALTTYMRNGTTWTSGQPTITKSSSSAQDQDQSSLAFGAIAGTQDLKMYALTNGTIYEYTVDEQDPLSWTWLSTVITS